MRTPATILAELREAKYGKPETCQELILEVLLDMRLLIAELVEEVHEANVEPEG